MMSHCPPTPNAATMTQEVATLETIDSDESPAASPQLTELTRFRLISKNPGFPDLEFQRGNIVRFGREGSTGTSSPRPNEVVQVQLFPDPRVSGKHCTLQIEQKGHVDCAVLFDESANGTYINSEKVGRKKSRQLQIGDVITFSLPLPRLQEEKNCKLGHYVFTERAGERNTGLLSKYSKGSPVGKGNFSTVYKGVQLDTGRPVAIKMIDKKQFQLDPTFDTNSLLSEVELLQNVRHKHIVQVFDVFDSQDCLAVVLELVTTGDLFNFILERKKFSEQNARKLMWQLVDALDYLHQRGIAHRDVKPENLLVVKGDPPPGSDDVSHISLKLTDFGLARKCSQQSRMHTVCGTPMYLAPEVTRNDGSAQGYSKSVDVWSAGVLLWVLLSGKSIPGDATTNGPSFPDEFFSGISVQAKLLITRMMDLNPSKRISIASVAQHPWMLMQVPEELKHVKEKKPVNTLPTSEMPPPAPRMSPRVLNSPPVRKPVHPGRVVRSLEEEFKSTITSPEKRKEQQGDDNQGKQLWEQGRGLTRQATPPPGEEDTDALLNDELTPPMRDRHHSTETNTTTMSVSPEARPSSLDNKPPSTPPPSHSLSASREGVGTGSLSFQTLPHTKEAPAAAGTIAFKKPPDPPVQQAVWYWKADLNSEEASSWKPYVEWQSEKIEAARQQGKASVAIGGVHRVAISAEPFQYRKDDTSKQRPVRRGSEKSPFAPPPDPDEPDPKRQRTC